MSLELHSSQFIFIDIRMNFDFVYNFHLPYVQSWLIISLYYVLS